MGRKLKNCQFGKKVQRRNSFGLSIKEIAEREYKKKKEELSKRASVVGTGAKSYWQRIKDATKGETQKLAEQEKAIEKSEQKLEQQIEAGKALQKEKEQERYEELMQAKARLEEYKRELLDKAQMSEAEAEGFYRKVFKEDPELLKTVSSPLIKNILPSDDFDSVKKLLKEYIKTTIIKSMFEPDTPQYSYNPGPYTYPYQYQYPMLPGQYTSQLKQLKDILPEFGKKRRKSRKKSAKKIKKTKKTKKSKKVSRKKRRVSRKKSFGYKVKPPGQFISDYYNGVARGEFYPIHY